MPIIFLPFVHTQPNAKKVFAFHCAFELFYCYTVMHLNTKIFASVFYQQQSCFVVSKFWKEDLWEKYFILYDWKSNAINKIEIVCVLIYCLNQHYNNVSHCAIIRLNRRYLSKKSWAIRNIFMALVNNNAM